MYVCHAYVIRGRECEYVYICMYVCVDIVLCLYMCMCVCVRTCVCVCVCVYAWEGRTRLNKVQRRANTEVGFILLEFG